MVGEAEVPPAGTVSDGHPLLVAISHGSLLVSLLLFAMLLADYLKSLSTEMRGFKDEVQKYQAARPHQSEESHP